MATLEHETVRAQAVVLRHGREFGQLLAGILYFVRRADIDIDQLVEPCVGGDTIFFLHSSSLLAHISLLEPMLTASE
jgi:hypothetical protein